MVFVDAVPEDVGDFARFVRQDWLVARGASGIVAAFYQGRVYISRDHGRAWESHAFDGLRGGRLQLVGDHCLAFLGRLPCESYCRGMDEVHFTHDLGRSWEQAALPFGRVESFGLASCRVAYIDISGLGPEPSEQTTAKPAGDDLFNQEPDQSENTVLMVTRDAGQHWKRVAPGSTEWRVAQSHLR